MMIDEIYTTMLESDGCCYVDGREEFFSLGQPAIDLLNEKSMLAPTEQERWLAEILLDRLDNLSTMSDLEQDFHEKILALKRGYPVKTTIGAPAISDDDMGLLLLGEEFPEEFQVEGEAFSEEELEWFDFIQVATSPPGPSLWGEVLLKGWTATVHPPPQITFGSPYGANPFSSVRDFSLENADYVRQAMVLLGKVGEVRAGARVVEILGDNSQLDTHRATAADVSSMLANAPAIPVLIDVLESNVENGLLVVAAIHSLSALAVSKIAGPLQALADIDLGNAEGDEDILAINAREAIDTILAALPDTVEY